MMHKFIMIKTGEAKKCKLSKKTVNFTQIGGNFINFVEIGGNMHHWLRGMDAPD